MPGVSTNNVVVMYINVFGSDLEHILYEVHVPMVTLHTSSDQMHTRRGICLYTVPLYPKCLAGRRTGNTLLHVCVVLLPLETPGENGVK